MKCIVKDGQELTTAAADGNGQRIAKGGDVLELPAHVAYEVRHLVDEVDATGTPREIGADEAAAAALRAGLETAKPHERISILRSARAAAAGNLTDIDQQIAAEEKRLAADAKKSAPKHERVAADTKSDASTR